MTHICIGNLTIICPDNGLSPGRRQAIIWTNAGILLIGPWGTNFSEISIGIRIISFKKMHLKMSSAKWHPFCLGLNVLSNGQTGAKPLLGSFWVLAQLRDGVTIWRRPMTPYAVTKLQLIPRWRKTHKTITLYLLNGNVNCFFKHDVCWLSIYGVHLINQDWCR